MGRYQNAIEAEYIEVDKGKPKGESITPTIPEITSIDPDTIEDLTEIEHFNNFNVFWQEYPKKKTGKKTAVEQWARLPRSSSLFGKIMYGLERAKRSQDWTNDDGRYILAPTRWLKEERWEDDYSDYAYGKTKRAEARPKNRFQNYEGRKWDYDKLALLEREFMAKL